MWEYISHLEYENEKLRQRNERLEPINERLRRELWELEPGIEHLDYWHCSCPTETASGGKFQPGDNPECADCGYTKAEYEDFYRENQARCLWRPKLTFS